MKGCNRCGGTFRLESFYKHSGCKQGARPECKACTNAAQGKYQATEAGLAARDRAVKAYRTKHPHRYKAFGAVSSAIQHGKMSKASDSVCEIGPLGCRGKREHHHDSYLPEDRLNVRVLCRKHHREWHKVNKPKLPPKGS